MFYPPIFPQLRSRLLQTPPAGQASELDLCQNPDWILKLWEMTVVGEELGAADMKVEGKIKEVQAWGRGLNSGGGANPIRRLGQGLRTEHYCPRGLPQDSGVELRPRGAGPGLINKGSKNWARIRVPGRS